MPLTDALLQPGLEAINALLRELGQLRDADRMLQTTVDRVAGVEGVACAAIFFADSAAEPMTRRAAAGFVCPELCPFDAEEMPGVLVLHDPEAHPIMGQLAATHGLAEVVAVKIPATGDGAGLLIVGHSMPMPLALLAIEATAGATLGAFLAHAEATTRDHAQLEALREEQERTEAARRRYSQLLNDVNAIVWEVDVETFQFTFVSDTAEPMTGYPVAEWYSHDFWLAIIHPDDVDWVPEYCARHLRSQLSFDFEYRIVARDGRALWIHDLVNVVRDESGRPTELRGLMVDITERKQLQNQLQQIQKLESLGLLAGGIAHDFNNLLTGILGNASLAQLTLPEVHPVRPRIDAIMRAAQRAADLTGQLLAYSGKGHFRITPVDVSSQLAELVTLLQASVPKKVELRLELGDGLPLVEADATQLQQVFMNLVINGAEALGGEPGSVLVKTTELTIAAEDRGSVPAAVEPGRYVVVEISDTGAGMDERTRQRIFDPFFTTKGRSRGLGLAAVLGIVRGHKGAIRTRSTPGSGTTFQVFLPASSAARVASPTPPRKARRQLSGTVLIIDDEDDVLETAAFMAERLGLRTIRAAGGPEGVESFQRHAEQITAVLLDMTMPEMNGDEVYHELRKRRPDVPIVLSSGFSEVDAIRRFPAEGLDGFLQKPYTLEQFAAAFAQLGSPA